MSSLGSWGGMGIAGGGVSGAPGAGDAEPLHRAAPAVVAGVEPGPPWGGVGTGPAWGGAWGLGDAPPCGGACGPGVGGVGKPHGLPGIGWPVGGACGGAVEGVGLRPDTAVAYDGLTERNVSIMPLRLRDGIRQGQGHGLLPGSLHHHAVLAQHDATVSERVHLAVGIDLRHVLLHRGLAIRAHRWRLGHHQDRCPAEAPPAARCCPGWSPRNPGSWNTWCTSCPRRRGKVICFSGPPLGVTTSCVETGRGWLARGSKACRTPSPPCATTTLFGSEMNIEPSGCCWRMRPLAVVTTA